MSPRRRVVLLGAGWAAERHAVAIRARGDAVVAIVDPSEPARERLAGQLVAVTMADLDVEALLAAGTDAVVVASPSAEHAAQADLVLEAGLPVLIEKPHRLPGQPSESLMAAARRDGVIAQVGMTTRYGAGLQAARQAVVDGTLGAIVWVEDRIWYTVAAGDLALWYFDRQRSGGGVLTTNGVHALDRVAWVLGEELVLGEARLWTLVPGREVEDGALVRLHGASGVEVIVSLLWAPYPVPSGALRLVGTRGVLTAFPDGSWTTETSGGASGGDAEDESAPFVRQWQRFCTALDGEAPPEPSIAELERTLTLIEHVYDRQGSRSG